MNQQAAVLGSIRTADGLGLSTSALRQQKVRTSHTLAGVTISTFTLVVSLAAGWGVDRAIVTLFREDERLGKIGVMPSYVERCLRHPARPAAFVDLITSLRHEPGEAPIGKLRPFRKNGARLGR
jgi:hypothetical protein